MSIQIQCQNCNHKYRVDDKFAGRTAKCQTCGAQIPIPQFESDNDDYLMLDLVNHAQSAPKSTPAPPQPGDTVPNNQPPISSAPLADDQNQSNNSFWFDLVNLLNPFQSISDAITFFFLFLMSIFIAFPFPSITVMMGKLVITGYICAFMFNIIRETANGDNQLPSFSDLTNIWDDAIQPFLMFVGSFLFAFLIPLIIAIILTCDQSPTAKDGIASNPLFLLSIAFAAFIWPMTMLALALGDSLSMLTRPDLIIRSIVSTFLPYIVACIFLYLTGFLWDWAGDAIEKTRGLVSILAFALLHITGLAMQIYAMRVIGLIYRHYKHKLAWAFE